ncbi:DUF2116 family Zn-ribbon domain-containing protein [Sulfuricurvum sp.]|uniref:DUF2116 family Zn-ribbon domain-containing protein n=1 Tax=Sulfuricurvum sp. TaxID=2025608 RepID=UPI00345954A9
MLSRECPVCGIEVESGKRRCSKCGYIFKRRNQPFMLRLFNLFLIPAIAIGLILIYFRIS